MTNAEKITAGLDICDNDGKIALHLAELLPLIFDDKQPEYMREAYRERYLHLSITLRQDLERLDRIVF